MEPENGTVIEAEPLSEPKKVSVPFIIAAIVIGGAILYGAKYQMDKMAYGDRPTVQDITGFLGDGMERDGVKGVLWDPDRTGVNETGEGAKETWIFRGKDGEVEVTFTESGDYLSHEVL